MVQKVTLYLFIGLNGPIITVQLKYMIPDENYVICMRLSQMGRVNDTPVICYDLRVTSKDVPEVSIT